MKEKGNQYQTFAIVKNTIAANGFHSSRKQ